MKKHKDKFIIGIDHGYGNIKTANYCFEAGLLKYDHEPPITRNMLVYDGKYYLIGEGHKEFIPEKGMDEDYYILTLAAIAKELSKNEITDAEIIIAAGLPLTWFGAQKEEFKKYLMKKPEVNFIFRGTEYHITISDIRVYPQGYAAVVENIGYLCGFNMVADIGNGTMNIFYVKNGRLKPENMFTEKFGTHQCTLAVREKFMQKTGREINDAIIDEVIRKGKADIDEDDLAIIREVSEEYVRNIFIKLREHGYDEKTMNLHIVGGGGCLIRNFCDIEGKRIKFVEDIRAAAKGYEYMALLQLSKGI
ncbi:MAG: ParM/StbA family protein [Oscillospiraceae bacterium]|nr:ParM/StbA family protein [Oscillospiraceae bacterium]MBQ3500636.1 ParM/StbA family protein [Oscillospiraceae bacterium]